MNDHKDDAFDLSNLWEALVDLEEGVLDRARREELIALLNRSPAARRAYLEFFQQSALFRMEAAKQHERDILPLVAQASQLRRTLRRPMWAAAALVALTAIIVSLITVTRPKPPHFAAIGGPATQWTIDGVAQPSGNKRITVPEGSTVRVESGIVSLETPSGNQLLLRGPAVAAFPALHRPQLLQGWLWIDVREADRPLQIEAAGLHIRDIGTRFGVRVPSDGPVEVHLIEGRAQVFAADTGKLLGDLHAEGNAFAFTPKVKSDELRLAADPFPSLPGLLQQPPNYRNTVLGQSPVDYWTFDDPNQTREDGAGYDENAARRGEPGIGANNGFPGFPETNHSIYLTGHVDKSIVGDLGGRHGVNRREGAVSFWIRRSPDVPLRDEVLWLAGMGDGALKVPTRAIMHTRINAAGGIVFDLETGTDRVRLSSTRNIVDGRWHHVVASWGPTAVDLYVDGHLVGRNSDSGPLDEGILRGRYVRFGKPSLDMPKGFGAFTGWVDEIALWDRALSPTEVGIQYRAAGGAAGDSGN